MSWFDVRVGFPFGLLRSYLDFLLPYDNPFRVLLPFKIIANPKKYEWYFKYPLSTRNVDHGKYRKYTESRSASETAIKFAPLLL